VAALIASKARGMQQRSDGDGGATVFFCIRTGSDALAAQLRPPPIRPERPAGGIAEAFPALPCCPGPDGPAGLTRPVPAR